MKRILVIEDDRIMRENISELLELVGYNVEAANNGKEGIKKAQTLLPDLIICDIKMPVLDGYGVLHILQKDSETASIPFIFLTAKTERQDLRKGMEMGADDYLAKPFEDTELLKAVEIRLKKNEQLAKGFTNIPENTNILTADTDVIAQLKDTIKDSKLFKYKPKEIIYKKGSYPHFLFYLEKGRAKSYSVNADGKEFISNIYEKGDFFGYRSIFEDRPYNDTVTALNETELLKIPKENFLNEIFKNTGLAGNIIKLISKNLTEKEEELVHMAYDSVRKRVAIKLQELIPTKEKNYTTISRTNFASLVGTSTETLVRTLTEMKDLQIIETDNHKITLLNRAKLKSYVKNW